MFSYFGILETLNLKSLDTEGFDVLHIGEDNMAYSFGIGKQNFINLLAEQFPDERDNIQRFIDSIYEMCSKIQMFNLKKTDTISYQMQDAFLIPVGDYIESFIKNKKLCSILAWNNNLYAGDKDSSPIYIHAIITKFYIDGASRFVDGSQQLADAMTSLIETHGGVVHCSSGVCNIIVNDKKVDKVITTDGREFTADVYISDIHPSALLDMIDPLQVKKSYRQRMQSLENSYSMFTVYIKLKKNVFPYLNSNHYYHAAYDSVWKSTAYEENAFPTGFMVMTPPKSGQTEFAETMMINCAMNYKDVKKWENTKRGNRGKEYENFKHVCQEKILTQVEQLFPNLRECIDKIFSSTPLSIRDYTGSVEGSIYGYKKHCQNMIISQVSPRTKIDNLLLTGQNINLHGIVGVPLNAIVTVGELVGVNYLIDKINCN